MLGSVLQPLRSNATPTKLESVVRELLETIAWISIAISFSCSLWIVADEVQHPQKMAVMNVVWPLTALYFSFFAVWAYYRLGRPKTEDAMNGPKHHESTAEQNPT